MDEQTRRKIYQTTSLVAGLAAIGAMLLVLLVPWQQRELKNGDIPWSVCCYMAMLGSVTSLVAAHLGKHVKPIQAVATGLSLVILPMLLLSDALRRSYADHFSSTGCRSEQRIALARLLPTPSASFPTKVSDSQLPRCTIIPKSYPWAPAMPRPVGMNEYLAGKKHSSIPHPERTIFVADCLPGHTRIRGSQDIDWDRHGSAIILLCNGISWNEHVCKREELIFNPWPKNAPRSPSPPARSRPAPPASRRP